MIRFEASQQTTCGSLRKATLYIYSGRPFSVTNSQIPGLLSATTGGAILADLLDPTILGIHCTDVNTRCFNSTHTPGTGNLLGSQLFEVPPSDPPTYAVVSVALLTVNPVVGEAIVAAHGEDFDLLLGRRTYDIWSGYWPKAGNSPMAHSINGATKYIATHRPDSLEWGPVEDLGPDIVAGIRRIKEKSGSHLIVWGSSTVTPVLLEHGLADEVLLLVFPVLPGKGKRFFSDGTPPRELALVSTKAASSGVVISTYKPNGALRTGSFDDGAA